jgi:RNA polymerase sigma factor (TIGR02999 family)
VKAVHFEADNFGQLLKDFRRGSREATDELTEALYPELRRLAAAKMKIERADHTWQPTALVNELYLQLLKEKALSTTDPDQFHQKQAFFGLAGHMMKRLLIHHARPLSRQIQKVHIDNSSALSHPAQPLEDVEDVLDRLAAIEPQLRSVVEMKVFEGLSVEDMAGRLNCSTRTVARHWNFAKHWLAKELRAAGDF